MKTFMKRIGTAWLGLLEDLVPFFVLLLVAGLAVLAVKHPVSIPFIAVFLLFVYSSRARDLAFRLLKGIGTGLGVIFTTILYIALDLWWVALLLLII